MVKLKTCVSGYAPLLLGTALTAPAVHAADHGGSCRLGSGITHIVQIQFDNVHLRRDNPNVPSDLEQHCRICV